MKQLFLIRHANSSWEGSNSKDINRPLNEIGINDAPKMGRRLLQNEFVPDLIVSSPAKRASSTAQLIATEINYSADKIAIEESIYHSTIAQLIQLIEELPTAADRVFLIGHNPIISTLVKELTTESYGTLPTTGVVGIEFSVDQWNAISKGSGSIIYHDYPENN